MFGRVGTGSITQAARGIRAVVLVSLALLSVSGCGGSGSGFETDTLIVPYTEEEQEIREEAQSARYRLRVGDRLALAFTYEEDLDQTDILVLPDGHISAAGLNNSVPAAGTTVDELDERLTTAYAADYRNPELAVIMQQIADPQVYVLGEVGKPGLHTMPNRSGGIIQAIALAGGFTENAHKSQTVLLRATPEGYMIRTFDLAHMEHVGFSDLTYFDMQPYDVVYVPRSSLGDWEYLTRTIFGSALDVTRFFWDIYAIANIDKIDRIVR